MSLPPDLQYKLGQERAQTLSSLRGDSRRPTAQRRAVVAVRLGLGRMLIRTGTRLLAGQTARLGKLEHRWATSAGN